MKKLLPSFSLYRLVGLALFFVAIVPTVLVSFILSNQVVERSTEQVQSSLQHRVNIQADYLKIELNQQFNALQHLAKNSDVILTPSSSVFGYQAEGHLNQFIQQFSKDSALYILDREHWAIEVAPLFAELIQLDPITPQIEAFLQQVEREQKASTLIFYIKDAAAVSILTAQNKNLSSEQQSPWLMVMALPLIQKTEHSNKNFDVVGSLTFIQPFEFLSPTFERWKPEKGSLSLLEEDTVLISSNPDSSTEHMLSLEATIPFGEKKLTLRTAKALSSLQAIVFEDIWRLSLVVISILVLIIIIVFVVIRLLRNQLLKLTAQVKAFSMGNYQFRSSGLRFSEFKQFSKVLEKLSSKVINDQNHLEQSVNERTQELKLVNTELSSTLSTLQETQDKLVQSEKMASLGQMVAGIAHEMNTPLGICVTAIGLIQESSGQLNEQISSGSIKKSNFLDQLHTLTNAADLVARNIHRSSELVAIFKELSLESEIEEPSHFELHTFLQQLTEVWSNTKGNQGLSITVSGEHMMLESYIGTLRRVLSILLENAKVHAFSNNLTAKTIELSCHKVDKHIEIIFCDNGTGINIEPIEKIFEPFYTSNRSDGSVGLGLHLAYNLVTQKLHGDILAENRPEGGLKLKLILPCPNC